MPRTPRTEDPLQRLRALPNDDRIEVLNAVHAGRAVNRAELAPLAWEYASLIGRQSGLAQFRKWSFWGVLGIAVPLAGIALGWIYALIIGLAVSSGPLYGQRRVRPALRAAALNRRLAAG